jgi:hypothetical protein
METTYHQSLQHTRKETVHESKTAWKQLIINHCNILELDILTMQPIPAVSPDAENVGFPGMFPQVVLIPVEA